MGGYMDGIGHDRPEDEQPGESPRDDQPDHGRAEGSGDDTTGQMIWSVFPPVPAEGSDRPAEPWPSPETTAPVSPPEGPPPRRGRVVLAAVLAALVLVTGGIGIGWVLSSNGTSSITTEAPLSPAPQTGSSSDSGSSNVDPKVVASKVTPAVVDVRSVIGAFGSDGGQSSSQAAGTGMVLTSSGQVLTNNHVIAGATSISVTIQGRSGDFKAIVIGADPVDDVALLQIQGVSGLSTVTLADSSGLKVGQQVVAIGNALGQGGDPTVTSGTITGLGRTITLRKSTGGVGRLSNLIQADAPISPGDSGGPLVNQSSQVVGVITAAATSRPRQRVSDVGYAIPSSVALGIVNRIRAGDAGSDIYIGQTGFLGVGVRNLEPADADRLGLDISSGALIIEVINGMPAARAGITTEAVITAIDGKKIASADELGPNIYSHKPGERINVTWVDKNGSHSATVTLAVGPAI